MATFDFDSTANVVSNTTPALKVINKLFCGKPGQAGLWMAMDNMNGAGWRKKCVPTCESTCTSHYVSTAPHTVTATNELVLGCGILNPRMLIIRQTALIREDENRRYMGQWRKGDALIKNDSGERLYKCARKYLVMFVDENNLPLHTEPIQLSARGTFQVSFSTKYEDFKKQFTKTYTQEKRVSGSRMQDSWYAMCVFVPKFKSISVGPKNASNACAVDSFEEPTPSTWRTLTVGYDSVVSSLVFEIFQDRAPWVERYKNPPQVEGVAYEPSLVCDFDE